MGEEPTTNLTVAKLKALCVLNDLSASGKKAELLTRLLEAGVDKETLGIEVFDEETSTFQTTAEDEPVSESETDNDADIEGGTGAEEDTEDEPVMLSLEDDDTMENVPLPKVDKVDKSSAKADRKADIDEDDVLEAEILEADLIDDEDIWSALKTAQFDDVVAQMPYGLYTMIGENGVKLSGGQRQRLALARAFYRGAKVLVLDEATSALDNRTEHDVLQALDLVGRRCTTIVIAHRLSTVKKCDRIVEIENGRIHAQGDFVSLCERSESFRDMYRIENT